jgi:hypothetical protein
MVGIHRWTRREEREAWTHKEEKDEIVELKGGKKEEKHVPRGTTSTLGEVPPLSLGSYYL